MVSYMMRGFGHLVTRKYIYKKIYHLTSFPNLFFVVTQPNVPISESVVNASYFVSHINEALPHVMIYCAHELVLPRQDDFFPE